MAARCATLSEFLTQAPVFKTVGPQSSGAVTVAVNPAPGDVFTLTDTYSTPNVVETYTADTDFAIGATPADTAVNLAAAIEANPLASASAASGVVTIVSTGTGPASMLAMATDNPVAMVLSGATLSGGDAWAVFALECTCSQINVECWGVKASCGHVYLAAHFLALQTGVGGGGGTVKRKKIDKVEVEYAVESSSDADLGATTWGRLYLQTRKSILVLPLPGRRIMPFIC
jgi:hypothetical protein